MRVTVMISRRGGVVRRAALAVILLLASGASHARAADDPPEPDAIDRLIEKLGSPQYVVRHRADGPDLVRRPGTDEMEHAIRTDVSHANQFNHWVRMLIDHADAGYARTDGESCAS